MLRYNFEKQEPTYRDGLELGILKTAFYEMEKSYMPQRQQCGDAYDAIPFSISDFLSIIVDAYQLLGKDKKFLDVGSGSGMKTKVASVLFDAYGIDINEEHVAFAQKFVNNIKLQDALTFENYGDYDLIYFYGPFKNDNLQKQLEDKIHNQMRQETLVAPIFSAYDWNKFPDMKKHGCLYEKL